jgi:hypothetical protein
MTYAKQMINGKIVALITYDYEPEFGEDDFGMVVIKEEEYNAILEEMAKEQPEIDPDPNRISDSEALKIITEVEK